MPCSVGAAASTVDRVIVKQRIVGIGRWQSRVQRGECPSLRQFLSSEGGLEGTRASLDLVLKWLTLRFFDTNPSVLLRSLDYLQALFGALAEAGYRMHDLEAASFLPYLVLKVSQPFLAHFTSSLMELVVRAALRCRIVTVPVKFAVENWSFSITNFDVPTSCSLSV